MDIVGCSLFGSKYLRCSECPVQCPPFPRELSSHALCVSSRSSPFAVSHHQHHHHHHPHHHHHHHSTCNSDFSTSICYVPNGTMKVPGSSIHRYRKSDLGFVLTLTVFFPRTMRVPDNIPPNGSLNRLSDDQPWQSWGALFSAPDIFVQL